MKTRTPPGEDRAYSGAVSKILEMLGGLLSAFAEARESVHRAFDRFLRRLEYVFFLYLWISIGMLLSLLGALFLLIDAGWASRGAVFLIGGSLVFLVSMVFLQTAKIPRGK